MNKYSEKYAQYSKTKHKTLLKAIEDANKIIKMPNQQVQNTNEIHNEENVNIPIEINQNELIDQKDENENIQAKDKEEKIQNTLTEDLGNHIEKHNEEIFLTKKTKRENVQSKKEEDLVMPCIDDNNEITIINENNSQSETNKSEIFQENDPLFLFKQIEQFLIDICKRKLLSNQWNINNKDKLTLSKVFNYLHSFYQYSNISIKDILTNTHLCKMLSFLINTLQKSNESVLLNQAKLVYHKFKSYLINELNM
jgi:hypothetical protein